jgi:diguanylate cyclase (GGDEF)-like protein
MPSEVKLAKHLLTTKQSSHEQLATMFAEANAGIVVFKSSQLIFANRSFAQAFGYESPKLLIGLSMSRLFIEEAVPGKSQTVITYGISAAGGEFSVHLEFTQIVLPDGPAHMGIIVSNLGMAKTQQELLHLSTHDSLTGLPNRSLFYDRLQHVIDKSARTGNQLALMFIDLVQFKNINDTFGHSTGDELLKRIALRFSSAVRQSDTVARLAGDEFTVLLEDVSNRNMVKAAANRILETVSRPYQLNGKTIRIGLSIGIAIYPEDAERLDGLIRCADMAMYVAKSSGRKCIKFYNQGVLLAREQHLTQEQVGTRA